MEAIERLESVESAIYGDPAAQKKGLFEWVNTIESQVTEIRSVGQKIIWLLVCGVLGALLNLVLNVKTATSIQHQPTAAEKR